MKTYIFDVEVEQERDERWSAVIPTLPGCSTWGYTRDEAMVALQEAAQAYLEVLIEYDDPLPKEGHRGVVIVDSPQIVAVTI